MPASPARQGGRARPGKQERRAGEALILDLRRKVIFGTKNRPLLNMLLNPLTFHTPETLSETLDLYANLQNARLKAGGTFLLNSLKLLKRKGTKTPDHIISLRKVAELQGISADEEKLTIQAMTTISEIFDSPLLTDNFTVLRTVCRNISTQPIRNMATLGGNLTCRYTWTEMPAVMIGLEAHLHFLGTNGQKEIIPAEEFFKNAAKTNKILSHVTIARDKRARIAYRRVKKTQFVDIPLLSLLIKTYIENGRFTRSVAAVNNCVDFAQRDYILEGFLKDKPCHPGIVQEALEHLDTKIYEKRSDDYKRHMFRLSIKSVIGEIVENGNT